MTSIHTRQNADAGFRDIASLFKEDHGFRHQTKTDREDAEYGAFLEAAGIQRKGGIYSRINKIREVTLQEMEYLT